MKPYTAANIPSMKAISALKKPFTAVSLFSGGGGASVGLRLAGYKILYANEFVPAAAAVYRANMERGTYLDTRDVRKVSVASLLKLAGITKGELDYLDASPPCKLFSAAASVGRSNSTKPHDEVVQYDDYIYQRVDDLFEHFVRLLRGVQPKVFVAENVPGLLAPKSKGYFIMILRSMESAGYTVRAAIVDPSLLGVPQRRRRLVFIGVRNDLKTIPVFPKPYTRPPMRVSEVLPEVGWLYRGDSRFTTSDEPGPTVVAEDHHQAVTGFASCGGWYKDRHGTLLKYSIPQLKRYFGFPQDFILDGVNTPDRKGTLKPLTFGQQWIRLGRTHCPLQVYNISATLREQILEKLR